MEIIWYPAITLDGFIAATDGDSDWVIPADEALFEKECQQAGCVIVGRTTFEQYKTLYPIEATITYVITSKASQLTSTDTITYVLPNAAAICERIAQDGFTSAVLSGGGDTNGLFAKAGKIDRAIVSIYPMLLGSGIRVLGSHHVELRLKLVGTHEIGQGVIQNRYLIIK